MAFTPPGSASATLVSGADCCHYPCSEPLPTPNCADCCYAMIFKFGDGTQRQLLRGKYWADTIYFGSTLNPPQTCTWSGSELVSNVTAGDVETIVTRLFVLQSTTINDPALGSGGTPVAINVWLYREIETTETITGSGPSIHHDYAVELIRAVYADADLFPCAPTATPDLWDEWLVDYRLEYPDGEDSGTYVPFRPTRDAADLTAVEGYRCGNCDCKCFGAYRSTYDAWYGTWSTPVRLARGCMAAWPDFDWVISPVVATDGRYTTATKIAYFDACTCASPESAVACVVPDTIDPPTDPPPLNCSGACCPTLVIAGFVNGNPFTATINTDGAGTCTYSGDGVTGRMVGSHMIVDVAVGDDTAKFAYLMTADGGTCPTSTDPGATVLEASGDGTNSLTAVECPDCDDVGFAFTSDGAGYAGSLAFSEDSPGSWSTPGSSSLQATATLSGGVWTIVVESPVAGPCLWIFTAADSNGCLPATGWTFQSAAGEGDCGTGYLS